MLLLLFWYVFVSVAIDVASLLLSLFSHTLCEMLLLLLLLLLVVVDGCCCCYCWMLLLLLLFWLVFVGRCLSLLVVGWLLMVVDGCW